MVLCGVVGGKRECPAKHGKMNVLSLLQPTGRDSGCSLLTPFEGGWAATLFLLRVSSTPPWMGMCFSQQDCSSSAHPAPIGNGNFSISQHTGWPCTLFSSSSLDMADPQPPCPGFSTMPCRVQSECQINTLTEAWTFLYISYISSAPAVSVSLSVWIQSLWGNPWGMVAISRGSSPTLLPRAANRSSSYWV